MSLVVGLCTYQRILRESMVVWILMRDNKFLYMICCNEPGCGTIENSSILVHRSQTGAQYF